MLSVRRMLRELMKASVRAILTDAVTSRLSVREAFFDVAAKFTPYVARESDGMTVFISTADQVIGRSVFLVGHFEEHLQERAFRAILELGMDFEGKTLVDVGANIGTTSLLALRRFGFVNVVAIEPDPQNFLLLRLNIVSNGLSQRISPINVALSDQRGTSSLELNPINSGDGRLVTGERKASVFNQESRGEVITVQTACFDDLVETGQIDMSNVGLVWMDVQGHEPYILKGAQELLRSKIPIVIEYWPYVLNGNGGLPVLEELIETNFARFIDLRRLMPGQQPVFQDSAKIRGFDAGFGPDEFTDLLLLKE